MPKHARSHDDITLILPNSVFLSCLELAIGSIGDAALLCCVCTRWRQQLLRNCRIRATHSDWRVMNDEVLKSLGFINVEELNLSGCYVLTDGSLPHLPLNLRQLNLAGCWNLSDGGVVHLSRLRALKELNLSYCADISGEVLPVIAAGCPKLERLYLKDCRGVTDQGVQALCAVISNLVEVDLDGCERVGNDSIHALAGAFPSTLQQLHLSNCKAITDQGLEALSSLKELTELNMDHCSNLTAGGLMSLSALTKMTHLNFNGCKLITQLSWISEMLGMEELHLAGCHVTDAGLQFVKGLRKLQALSLNCCWKLSDTGLLQALPSLSQLKWLGLGSQPLLTDGTVATALANMPLLEHVDLGNCRQVGDAGLGPVLPGLLHLRELIVSRCAVSDQTILAMANVREMNMLHLGGCVEITDASLRFISQQWRRLSVLNLEHCVKITDQGVACLSVLTSLQRLQLAHCSLISDEGVRPLLCLTQLRQLGLEGSRATRELALFFPTFVASDLTHT